MADEYWKRYLTGSYQDWGYEDDDWETDWYTEDYQYTPESTQWGSQESISLQESYPPYEGDIDSSLWYSQDKEYQEQAETQSFLDMYGTTEEEFNALGFGEPGMEAWDAADPSWQQSVYAHILGAKGSALDFISSMTGGLKTAAQMGKFFQGMRGGGPGGQAQRQQVAGVSQRGRMPVQGSGGLTRMPPAGKTANPLARVGLGGSKYGVPANEYFRNSQQANFVNNQISNATAEGVKAASLGLSRRTIPNPERLRLMQIAKTAVG